MDMKQSVDKAVDKTPDSIFVDGIHDFTLDGDCVLIDMFVLRGGDDNPIEREQVTQLRIPVTQFFYMAKSMMFQSERLTGTNAWKPMGSRPSSRQPEDRFAA